MRHAFGVAQAAALGVVISRLLPGARRLPALLASGTGTNERVSVIVPARDEAARIEACVSAVMALDGVDEVIVVDDESTDETAAIARRIGATVIAGAPLPAGWVGKPWALHQGIAAARNNIVVLLDADTVAQPGLVLALLEELQHCDIVTLAPRFLTSSAAEQGLHAAMLAALVYRFGAVGSHTTANADRVYGNGQCLAFRRDWLINEGGMELVASHMNDDIALLRALASRGARISFRDGRHLLQVRMYDTTAEVWNEWGRSLPMVDTTTKAARWFDLAILWLVLAAPPIRLMTRHASAVDIACLMVRYGMTRALAPSYASPRKGALLSPLFDVAATIRLTQATRSPVREWRGRRYMPPGNEARRMS
jgi:dolichol-phosphate mannosyltransferase